MATRTIFLTGLRILAVCLLHAVCFTVGGVLSGIDKVAQQSIASQSDPLANLLGALSPTLSSGLAGMAGRSSVLSS